MEQVPSSSQLEGINSHRTLTLQLQMPQLAKNGESLPSIISIAQLFGVPSA